MKKTIGLFALFMSISSAFAGYVSMTIGEYVALPDCGGTLKVTESSNGGSEQVNLVFHDIVNCSKFDIVGLDGYRNKDLQGRDRARSASFTIPKRAIGEGFNAIQVVLHSNSRKTSDTVNVMFINTGSSPSTGTGGY